MATILVIDDEEGILDLIRTVIAEMGHKTTTAPALWAVPQDARPDLVILDLVPLRAYRRAPALEWVGLLRERFAGTPLLIVTAHADAVAEADRLGADAILGKPFEVDQLAAKIDELLAAGRG